MAVNVYKNQNERLNPILPPLGVGMRWYRVNGIKGIRIVEAKDANQAKNVYIMKFVQPEEIGDRWGKLA